MGPVLLFHRRHQPDMVPAISVYKALLGTLAREHGPTSATETRVRWWLVRTTRERKRKHEKTLSTLLNIWEEIRVSDLCVKLTCVYACLELCSWESIKKGKHVRHVALLPESIGQRTPTSTRFHKGRRLASRDAAHSLQPLAAKPRQVPLLEKSPTSWPVGLIWGCKQPCTTSDALCDFCVM